MCIEWSAASCKSSTIIVRVEEEAVEPPRGALAASAAAASAFAGAMVAADSLVAAAPTDDSSCSSRLSSTKALSSNSIRSSTATASACMELPVGWVGAHGATTSIPSPSSIPRGDLSRWMRRSSSCSCSTRLRTRFMPPAGAGAGAVACAEEAAASDVSIGAWEKGASDDEGGVAEASNAGAGAR